MSKKSKRLIKKTSKKKSVIRAISPNGLVHEFDPSIEALAEDFELKYGAKQKSDLFTAFGFDNFISKQKLQLQPTYILNNSVYRVVPPAPHPLTTTPLSVAGSLSDGGRFNIGGAQLLPALSHLNKWGCLYVASSINCALSEAASPRGNLKKFELKFKNNKPLVLWDLKLVISHLNYSNLLQMIKDTPVDAVWGYQKVPKPSQILSSYLKQIGGDGIIFESTKSPAEFNIALFFWNDEAVANVFQPFEITP